jgi:hypothetical protein
MKRITETNTLMRENLPYGISQKMIKYFWTECNCCHLEFKHETMWRFRPYDSSDVYLCLTCAPNGEQAGLYFKEHHGAIYPTKCEHHVIQKKSESDLEMDEVVGLGGLTGHGAKLLYGPEWRTKIDHIRDYYPDDTTKKRKTKKGKKA